MANRYTLHINSLEVFQNWLVADGWEIEKPKGTYEVLRARKAGRQQPLIVYTKADAKEHLTVMDRDFEIVRAFLRDKKKTQTNADRIRSMTENDAGVRLEVIRAGLLSGTDVKIVSSEENIEAITVMIDALEELQRWHTSEINPKIKNVFANTSTQICHNCDHKDEYIEELEAEVEEYQAIGTPEECRAAMEKQTAKKPRIIGNAMICPSCPRCFKSASPTYCPSCGQWIDWGNEE